MAHVFTEDYAGPRFKYGFINRPLMIGTAPKGFIIGSYKENDKPETAKGRARWGTVEYPFPLSDDDVYAYELLDLN
jgi:hypothetical protein